MFGEQVCDAFNTLTREQKLLFGGPPYSSEISRELQNTEVYSGVLSRSRTCLASTIQEDGVIAGYEATTIMHGANPTIYEKEHLRLSDTLNYVQLKKIFVVPSAFGTGVAQQLLTHSFSLADEHNKDWVVDVNAQNYRMLSFLQKYGVTKRFSWSTPKGTRMFRLGL